jgi:hypothetical protein
MLHPLPLLLKEHAQLHDATAKYLYPHFPLVVMSKLEVRPERGEQVLYGLARQFSDLAPVCAVWLRH